MFENMFEIIFYILISVALLIDLSALFRAIAARDPNLILLSILACLTAAGSIIAQILVGHPWGVLLILVSSFFNTRITRITHNNMKKNED
jgi:hypothetical protein